MSSCVLKMEVIWERWKEQMRWCNLFIMVPDRANISMTWLKDKRGNSYNQEDLSLCNYKDISMIKISAHNSGTWTAWWSWRITRRSRWGVKKRNKWFVMINFKYKLNNLGSERKDNIPGILLEGRESDLKIINR